jgi:hypothetical protein
MKSRFYLFAFIVILCVIVLIVYVASQPRVPRTSATPDIVSCTINSAIGIDKVNITNLNTGKTTARSLINLPFSFNCTEGDYLKISVTTLEGEGYVWDSWWFDKTGVFDNTNPMIVRIKGDLTLTPTCIFTEVTPPPIPSPSPSPSPSPTPSPSE